MLLEHGIRDISRVLVLARNLVYSACSVEDTILHVYKMEGHWSFRENPLILSSWRLYLVVFSVKNVISYENKMDTTAWKWMMQTSDTNNNTVEPVHTACVLHHIFSWILMSWELWPWVLKFKVLDLCWGFHFIKYC